VEIALRVHHQYVAYGVCYLPMRETARRGRRCGCGHLSGFRLVAALSPLASGDLPCRATPVSSAAPGMRVVLLTLGGNIAGTAPQRTGHGEGSKRTSWLTTLKLLQEFLTLQAARCCFKRQRNGGSTRFHTAFVGGTNTAVVVGNRKLRPFTRSRSAGLKT